MLNNSTVFYLYLKNFSYVIYEHINIFVYNYLHINVCDNYTSITILLTSMLYYKLRISNYYIVINCVYNYISAIT